MGYRPIVGIVILEMVPSLSSRISAFHAFHAFHALYLAVPSLLEIGQMWADCALRFTYLT